MINDPSTPGAQPNAPRFLFLVGPPRSTNNVTLATLDGHPDILAWPTEFPFFHYFKGVAKGRERVPVPELNEAMLAHLQRQLNERLGHGTNGEADLPIYSHGDAVGGLDTRILVDRLVRISDGPLDATEYLTHMFEALKWAHSRYRSREVKYYAILVMARGMDWANDELFESHRVLFPYRDMLDSYASIRERGLKSESPPQYFGPTDKKGFVYWAQTFERISQLAQSRAHHDNFFVASAKRVRYEPDKVISEICDFLGIDPSASALSEMTMAGQSYGGNARENGLNTGTFAPRSSRRTIPMSSFERKAFAALDLYDFDEGKRLRSGFGLLAMATTAFRSAFCELYDKKDSTWRGTGGHTSLARRLKLAIRLAGTYFVLRGGILSRLVPRRSSGYNLDSLD